LMGQALQLHPMQRSWQIEQVNGRNRAMFAMYERGHIYPIAPD
jgi:hypothetical protein